MSKRIKPLKTMMVLSVMLLLVALGLHSALSGQLDPASAPGPTMYTLEEIYNFRGWKMMGKTFVNHPGNTRFAIYDAGTAADTSDDLVLDKETGLIWAREPDSASQDFWSAILVCRSDTELGDRKGWRLPSVEELSSLIDLSQDSPALPANHPFTGVLNDWYWTDPPAAMGAVAWADGEDYNYVVNMGDGTVNYYADAGYPETYVWCVWGGKSNGL